MSKKLIVILGPTGVGKTDLSIEIASAFNAPIVSSDSRQLYKEMSIGTAVPSKEQLSAVSHYFIQTKSIAETYTAGKYEKEALDLLSTLFIDHDYIVLAGGSGLYIDALCNGIDEIPAANREIRDSLEKRLLESGIDDLLIELKKLDPVFYEQIDKDNHRRVIRALEACISSNKPYSSQRRGEIKKRDFEIIKIGINIDRELLYERINNRVDIMVEQGLISEATSLYKYRDHSALQTVGYREIFDYLEKKTTLEEAIDLIKRNSRRYAKRQMTWFNRDHNTLWFKPNQKDKIIEFIKTSLS